MLLLNDQQMSLMQAPYSSIWMGSCSLERTPDIARLTGVLIADDRVHLDLFIPQKYANTFFNNIQNNLNISFLCASTQSFEAYQIKGIFINWRHCNAEEQRYQQNYVQGFANNLIGIGVRSVVNFVNYYQEPSIAIRMRSEAIYEQTPKAGTGNKIG